MNLKFKHGSEIFVYLLLAALWCVAFSACASPANSAAAPTNNAAGLNDNPIPPANSSTPASTSPPPTNESHVPSNTSSTPANSNPTPTDEYRAPADSNSTPAANNNLTPTKENDSQPGNNSAAAGNTLTATPSPVQATNYVVDGSGNTNVEQAHAQLLAEGNPVYLVLLSVQSTGVEAQIYRDLTQRNFRTTVGPDEGIDTHNEFCYPNCVFVLQEAANVIGVAAWTGVLQHEYRHIIQEEHNPNMAQDFRDPNGQFTTYAAFEEACADYGLNVAPMYQAQARMNQLKSVLWSEQDLIDPACTGDQAAYQNLVNQYNQKEGNANAFQQLFPQYH